VDSGGRKEPSITWGSASPSERSTWGHLSAHYEVWGPQLFGRWQQRWVRSQYCSNLFYNHTMLRRALKTANCAQNIQLLIRMTPSIQQADPEALCFRVVRPSVCACVLDQRHSRPACHRPIVARIVYQSGIVTGQPNACYTVVNFRNVTFRSYGSKLWLLWSSSRVIFQIHLITDGFSPTGTPVLLIVSWNELPTVDRLLSRVTESADRLIQL